MERETFLVTTTCKIFFSRKGKKRSWLEFDKEKFLAAIPGNRTDFPGNKHLSLRDVLNPCINENFLFRQSNFNFVPGSGEDGGGFNRSSLSRFSVRIL